MVNQHPVESPMWWVERLSRKLRDDQPTMDLWWRYFTGDHPYPEMPDKIRERVWERYLPILRRSRANFMGVIIDSPVERLRPIGFRLGADSNHQSDEESWMVWQASNMDADAPLGFETALAKGRAYLSVWKRRTDEFPTIAIEDPSQCIVENEPGSRHRRVAALKTYVDDWTGEERAELFLRRQGSTPAGLYRFRRDQTIGAIGGWVALEGNDAFEPNPVGWDGIPIVPMVNRPRLTTVKFKDRPGLIHGGDSDLADVTYIQDRINETILNRVIAQWFAAFRQRWATGLTVDEEEVLDNDGNPVLGTDGEPLTRPVEPFDVYLDRMIAVGPREDGQEVKFGDFAATDIGQYLKSHERDLQDLSTITRIPRHYLFQEGQSPSGDAIKSAETGLVARTKRKQLDQGESLEEAMRIARLFQGDGEARPDSEIVWADPEYQTYGQLVDGVIKEFESGLIPWEGAMEKLGYSPQQIARFRGQRNMDALLTALEDEEEPETEPQVA